MSKLLKKKTKKKTEIIKKNNILAFLFDRIMQNLKKKNKKKNRNVKKPVAKVDFQTDFSALVCNYKVTI